MAPIRQGRGGHPENLFDLVRVSSAAVVIVYHSFPLSGTHEPFHDVLGITLGTGALLALFAISGYLVTQSWLGDDRARAYVIKRALRVFPGLILCSFLVALVLGPIVSSLSPGQYFAHSGPYAYAVKQSVLDTFNPALPGVFTHNPLAGVVNGSTWTLPVEVSCWLAVMAAGLTGALRRPSVLLAGLGLVVVAMVLGNPADSALGHVPAGTDKLFDALRPCGAFLGGVILCVLRARIPVRAPLIVAAVAVLFAPVGVGVHSALDMLAIPYLAIAAGVRPAGRLRVLTAWGDASYGTYIYAYPIQQTLVHSIPGISAVGLIGLGLPLGWLAGVVSWNVVERRALAQKARLAPRVAPAPELVEDAALSAR
jgi:peptidoglycan/LPS O-acetylase OafA/YrhL